MTIPLKEAIAEKHRLAEQTPVNQRMFRGELSPYEYGMYLRQLLEIFTAIEQYDLPHPMLNRREKIVQDIADLQWKLNHLIQLKDALYVLNTTRHYVSYLSSLTPIELEPHMYLHYLAIMFGGQMMKSKVPGQGHMYDFDDMYECIKSIRDIQQDSWADEANKGLDYFIDILDELHCIFRFSR